MENVQKLLVLLTSLILGFHAFGCFGCYRDELEALLQLKSEINYPNGSSLPHWMEEEMGEPSNCCDWFEVSCGKSGRIVGLYLLNVRQPEIGDWFLNASVFLPFRHLQLLNLYGNSIIGWTHHLRELSSLKELYLGYNNLHAMIDLYDIEALQNLETLEVSDSRFDGFKRIHGNPHGSSKLKTLYLNNITFHDANTMLDSLSSFSSLTTLNLQKSDLKGAIETTGILCQLKKIQRLVLGQNDLGGKFPVCLRNLKSLRYLDLSENNLHGILPSFLANFTSLRFLDLSSNHFVGNIANSPLTKLTSLNALSLLNNNFKIPKSFEPFANISTLKVLWLDGNNVVPSYATHQPFPLKFQLTFLSLSNCNISATLPSFILHQYNLTYVDLSHNYIEGSFPLWIMENNTFLDAFILADNLIVGSLKLSRHPHSHVEALDVSNNKINHLSENLSVSLPNLLFLNLSRNFVKAITPLTFQNMRSLSFIDLSYNHLTGEMPKQFLKGCYSLQILRLNNNNISGMIPPSLFSKSLVSLIMSNNHLDGRIPAEICKLDSLGFLDLSNNSLSGFFPSCFNISSLVYVYLNKNKLNGPLLPIFRNNTSLVTLDLGYNHLSGEIPEWIGDLRSLSVLSLRNNHFEGYIPYQFCSLDQLTILDLSSNNISGKLPHCLSQMTFQPLKEKSAFQEDIYIPVPDFGTEVIALFFEYKTFASIFFEGFTMQLEMEITIKSHTYTYIGKDLDVMSTFDLSCNKLNGEIPREIGGIIGVHALNFSHNELSGLIPSTLSELRQIESLDLSYNNLNGSIPSELTKLNALAVFTVAHNNLSGRIPEQKAQFATFGESSYEGNPLLCGPPLLKDCSISSHGRRKDKDIIDVDSNDGSMDMEIFFICFVVSSVIMCLGTLIVLYVNPYWRTMWFYYGEMWISWIYYFVVDIMVKGWKTFITSMHGGWKFMHCP